MRKKEPGRVRLALGLLPERRHFTVKANLRGMLQLAEQAGRAGADIVAFEEGGLSLFTPKAEKRITVPGPETRALAAVARTHRMYLAATMLMGLRSGKCANVVVLFDRQGKIQYIYHKQQLTDGELAEGIVPGNECVPVETDFGKVGFLICYDTQFPELPRLLGNRGADLVICPHVGGAGPGGGKLLGGADANRNGYWLAWVGRSGLTVINPLGEPVAQSRDTGKLLVTDLLLRQPKLVGALLDWRTLQLYQQRPDLYGAPIPPVVIHAPKWPLYNVNPFPHGPTTLELVLRNRSRERQRGVLKAEFPLNIRYRSHENQAYFIDHEVNGCWGARPSRIPFDLRAGGEERVRLQVNFPPVEPGIYLVRVSGKTHQGEPVLWQRQLQRAPSEPTLTIPRIARPEYAARRGATMPIVRDFFNSPARSRTEVRLGWSDDAFVLHAVAHRFGPWIEDREKDPECVTFAIQPDPDKTDVYWLTVYRSGRTTAQHREHGAPIQGGTPHWQATVQRTRNCWTALVTIPFQRGIPRPRVGDSWRMNVERHAILTPKLEAARRWCVVQTPQTDCLQVKPSVGCEWADWNPTWSRADAISAYGRVTFQGDHT